MHRILGGKHNGRVKRLGRSKCARAKDPVAEWTTERIRQQNKETAEGGPKKISRYGDVWDQETQRENVIQNQPKRLRKCR